jgi:hypothetical protein
MEARDLLRERPNAFELALRIRHPSMDPALITRELRLSPEHSFKAGEPRESSSGIAAAAVHCESYWLASLNPNEWPAEQLADFDFPRRAHAGAATTPVPKERLRTVAVTSVGMALSLSTSHFLRTHADFLRRIQTEGGDVALIVEMPPSAAQSFTLTPQVSKVLADYGVSIDFEFTSD